MIIETECWSHLNVNCAEPRLYITAMYQTERYAMDALEYEFGTSMEALRKRGWRIVRVKLTAEVEG